MKNTRRDWFFARIGKTVYRKSREMDTPSSKKNGYVSVLLIDEQHAGYLCDLEGDFAASGDIIRYYDSVGELIAASDSFTTTEALTLEELMEQYPLTEEQVYNIKEIQNGAKGLD